MSLERGRIMGGRRDAGGGIWGWLFWLCVVQSYVVSQGYVVVVPSELAPGAVVFEAGVPALGGRRRYQVATSRTAWFARKLLRVHPQTGRVSLARELDCDGLHYPRLFTFHLESTSSRLGRASVDYYSIALRLYIAGCDDDELQEQSATSTTTETLASYAMFSAEGSSSVPREMCLRASQLVASLRDFLPLSARRACEVRWPGATSDPRFLVEGSAGDLVSATEQCLLEPLFKVSLTLSLRCGGGGADATNWKSGHLMDAEHRLKIVFHHQPIGEDDDTELGRRVRRELKNQSPVFEQPLYVASVEEEREPGLAVATLKARDPEGGPVKYSMSSLLDSRSQALFHLEPANGRLTTQARLDREALPIHYFKVLAVDDSFPPRTATTTLQVNVLDVNDHAPSFEWPEYDATVRESVPVGSSVVAVKASDQDAGRNAELEYSLELVDAAEDDDMAFRIDAKSGLVTTRLHLDREIRETYALLVRATDLASPASARQNATASLLVRVLDDNDNYPQFSERAYTVQVPEDLEHAGHPTIARVRATDADAGPNALVRYAIIGGNGQGVFSIDSQSGDVSLVKALDYETARSYRIVVRAQDAGLPARSNTTQLLVHVKDVNDNPPRFYANLFQETVSESEPVGYSIVRVQAYDADEGANAKIRYAMSPRDALGAPTEEFPIAVAAETGWVYTIRQLDREERGKYAFAVVAVDGGEPALSASASVVLTVSDVNDNDPYFEPKTYEAQLSESEPPGSLVASVSASDPDEDARVHYEITAGNTRARFAVSSHNGRGLVTLAQALDYKQEKRFALTITASDSGGRTDTAFLYVNVTDANNYAPVFENAPYAVSVFEDAPVGTTVLLVAANDLDVGENARLTYTLLGQDYSAAQDGSASSAHGSDSSGSPGGPGDVAGGAGSEWPFAINAQTGAVTTTRALDREQMAGYLLTVQARDGGTPVLSDTTDVEITVADVNDNAPVFEAAQYQGSVPEDALLGTSVLRLAASDLDAGLNGRVRYALEDDAQGDGAFALDPATGVLRTAKALDRESQARYTLRALAIDRGTPALSTAVTLTIRVEDVNDSPPVFPSDKILLYIPENSPIGSTVGEIYAHDPDEGINGHVEYSIVGGEDAGSFALNALGPERAELTSLEELDYESPKKRYELVVRASSPPLRSDALVHVLVTDINDNAPRLSDFLVLFNNYEQLFPSGPIGRVPAFDADVTDRLTYRVLAGNNANLVYLNITTGELTLSPQLNTNVPRVASMEVSVSDGLNEAKATMTLSVRLVTEEMLLSSVTVRLEDMSLEAFLSSTLLGYFLDGLAAVVPCPRDHVHVIGVAQDAHNVLNVSFAARRPELGPESFYSPQFLRERVYLNRAVLTRLATVNLLPFDDNLCIQEPCLNFEECSSVLKFANASDFVGSETVLLRPIQAVSAFACRCGRGFTGSREAYLCDTEVNLCYSGPCKNGGTCRRREAGYTCECVPGFTGDDCQLATGNKTIECVESSAIREERDELCRLRSRSFGSAGPSFLTFESLKQRHRLHLRLSFASEAREGLLLYNGRYNEQHDFLALEIIEGQLELSFSLGDEEVTRARAGLPGPRGVSDGRWHEVRVSYLNRSVDLVIDDCDVELALRGVLGKPPCAARARRILEPRCALVTETCHRFLDLTGPLQVGGLPALPGGPARFPVRGAYLRGCVRDLHVDHRPLDLDAYVADNGSIAGCPEKRPTCASTPCAHGATCRELWGGFACDCPEGFAGPHCAEVAQPPPWRFRRALASHLSFNPLLKPIQLPWLVVFSLQTPNHHRYHHRHNPLPSSDQDLEQNQQQELSSSFLASVQIGQNSSVTLRLDEKGHLVAALDGIDVIRSDAGLTDGRWHRVELLWQAGQVALDLDYRGRPLVSPLSAKLQGLYVGRILLGAADYLSPNLLSFDGCLQDVRIGTNQSALQRPTLEEKVELGCGLQEEEEGSGGEECECPTGSSCVRGWTEKRGECECVAGRVGPLCVEPCAQEPCSTLGTERCEAEPATRRGYKCVCSASNEFSGDYCEVRNDEQPCPASWWGAPVCGPCGCDETRGYDAACDKATGACHCKENHYKRDGTEECAPCECYALGSFGPRCEASTGQCRCRPGVIGRDCSSCPNAYAEVTLRGCEVVYDGCPRSRAAGLWWPRTPFPASGAHPEHREVVLDCPVPAQGRASRLCSAEALSWLEPDLFNCTSGPFLELRRQLAGLEARELALNTYVAVRLGRELREAARVSEQHRQLYGADLLVVAGLLSSLLAYEGTQSGLNLTHSQDKDYAGNLLAAAGLILRPEHAPLWQRARQLNATGLLPEELLLLFKRYLAALTASQHDTFTSPFELVDPWIVLGLDVVTSESLFGFESDRKVELPDTSGFLTAGPMLAFPKYNNYMADPKRFDPFSRVQVPLSLLGIREPAIGEQLHGLPGRKAVLGYVQFRGFGALLPKNFDDSVAQRWGVQLDVASPVLVPSVLVPKDDGTGYESLTDVPLQSPVQVRLWLGTEQDKGEERKRRSNPQCVHWSTLRNRDDGSGEWSRMGCTTEVEDGGQILGPGVLVNCSCLRLSALAVLTDVFEAEYVPEPSLLEDVASYGAFLLALPLLLTSLLVLSALRGQPSTNSNSVHKNLLACVFAAELLYFMALKARRPLGADQLSCKLTAIGLHYAWLATFAWTLVDSLHLYRMLTEMRDVNHGPMRFYYALGYGLPALVVCLSLGVRADQYGNFYFCWLSIYEKVIWAMIGPVCLAVAANVCTLALAVRAAFSLKEHVLGFGNLRTLLWLSVASLPLLGTTWSLSVLAASENSAALSYLLSASVLAHATFSLLGYCIVNGRVRENLCTSLRQICLGQASGSEKSPETGVVEQQQRSALAYTPSSQQRRRRARLQHAGVSTSSTTSRSTSKTASSPYRSDAHLRNTSTSTSNYNGSEPYLQQLQMAAAAAAAAATSQASTSRKRRDESSEEDEEDEARRLEQQSLELASSHSSDEDEHVNSRGKASVGVTTQRRYHDLLPPGICKSIYAPSWSSQLPPEACLQWPPEQQEPGQTASPNPLPYPELLRPGSSTDLASKFDADELLSEGGDKYLFPYTAEEDHVAGPPPAPPNLHHLDEWREHRNPVDDYLLAARALQREHTILETEKDTNAETSV